MYIKHARNEGKKRGPLFLFLFFQFLILKDHIG